jgi:DNA-binding transcriptional ArsR family regulator
LRGLSVTEKAGNEVGIDPRLVDLASDSVRRDALMVLNERTANAAELAGWLGVEVATMSDHLEKMRAQGLVEIVGESRGGGGEDAPRYRALVRALWSSEEWATLSMEERRQLSNWIVRMIVTDADVALESGTFNARDDSHASRTSSVVDERGWRELTRIFAEALEASFAVQAESAERLAESGAEGVRVMSAMLCFELPGPSVG